MSCIHSTSHVCNTPSESIDTDRVIALSKKIAAVYDTCKPHLPEELHVSVKALLPEHADDIEHSVQVIKYLHSNQTCEDVADDIACLQNYLEYINTYDWRVAYSVMHGLGLPRHMDIGLQSTLCGREPAYMDRGTPSVFLVTMIILAVFVGVLLLYMGIRHGLHKLHLQHGSRPKHFSKWQI